MSPPAVNGLPAIGFAVVSPCGNINAATKLLLVVVVTGPPSGVVVDAPLLTTDTASITCDASMDIPETSHTSTFFSNVPLLLNVAVTELAPECELTAYQMSHPEGPFVDL